MTNTITDQESAVSGMIATNKWGTFFGISQQTLDTVWGNLTQENPNSVAYVSMEIGADLDVFNPVQKQLHDLQITKSTNTTFDYYTKLFLNGPQKIPNYGGGLGILAGDTLKSMAEMKIPIVAISLLYRKGYFSQLVDATLGQISTTADWSPENTPSLYLMHDPENPTIPLEIKIPFFDEHDNKTEAYARIWLKLEINHTLDYFTPEILLDYSTPTSPEWIQEAAQHLYESRTEQNKIIQRRLLGAGMAPALNALGLTVSTIHLNEQHGVVAILHLIGSKLQETFGSDYQMLATDEDIINIADAVAANVVYTIHTPVKAGHDRFEKSLYSHFGHTFCHRILHLLAVDDEQDNVYNFTTLAMRVNRATNSVSRLHRSVTRKQFPQFAEKITAITNGVNHLTWISDAKAELYNSFKELHGWQHDPSIFTNCKVLQQQPKFRSYFQQAWYTDTKSLIEYVNAMLIRHRNNRIETWIDPPNYLSYQDLHYKSLLSPDAYTIGFARRFSTYKRADLIFDNIDKLARIIKETNSPINFIFAGKAHPADEPGKNLIKQILSIQKELFDKTNGLGKLVFIPNYDMKIAKLMVAGVHAWLNSPKRPLEASGTSGMKAAMNGIPNISIMDGWWDEGYHNGLTGWKFGLEINVEEACLSEDKSTLLYKEDAASLYRILPDILEAFYADKQDIYINKCLKNIELNIPIFNTHRMAAEYVNRYELTTLPPAIQKHITSLQKAYNSNQDD